MCFGFSSQNSKYYFTKLASISRRTIKWNELTFLNTSKGKEYTHFVLSYSDFSSIFRFVGRMNEIEFSCSVTHCTCNFIIFRIRTVANKERAGPFPAKDAMLLLVGWTPKCGLIKRQASSGAVQRGNRGGLGASKNHFYPHHILSWSKIMSPLVFGRRCTVPANSCCSYVQQVCRRTPGTTGQTDMWSVWEEEAAAAATPRGQGLGDRQWPKQQQQQQSLDTGEAISVCWSKI